MFFALYLIFWSAFWDAMTKPLHTAEVIYLDQWRADHRSGNAA